MSLVLDLHIGHESIHMYDSIEEGHIVSPLFLTLLSQKKHSFPLTKNKARVKITQREHDKQSSRGQVKGKRTGFSQVKKRSVFTTVSPGDPHDELLSQEVLTCISCGH